jgi:Dolichyl-phosphate-mannose-protein mannosyltransferase
MGDLASRHSGLKENGTIQWAVGIVGIVLIAAGRWMLEAPNAADRIVKPLPAITIGIMGFLLGTLLVALALRRGVAAKPDIIPDNSIVVEDDTVGRVEWRWLGATALPVGAFYGLFLTGRLGWPLAIAWLLALATAGVHFARLDRRRGTPLGWFFDNRREIGGLVLCMFLAAILVGHDLTSWRWAGTPDEIRFFQSAIRREFEGLPREWFSENGLWGYHPMLSHYYQALFLRVFGVNLFAWRLSSLVAFAASLPFLYLLVRELWNARVAWMAIIFFASAPLAVGFAHLGYNNIQSFPFLTASLGIFAWSMRRKTSLGYFLAGVAAGLGFYTFYAARISILLILILGISARAFPWRGRGAARSLALAAGLGLAILPWLLTMGAAIQNMREQTLFRVTTDPLPQQYGILSQWGLSLLHTVYSVGGTSHFLVNPLLDPISSALAWVGIWLACHGARRDWRDRFLLATLVLSALVVGSLSPYGAPPLTRLFFLAPFYAIFAAIALDELRLGWLGGDTRRPKLAALACGAILATSVAANTFALQRGVRSVYHGFGDGAICELIRLTLPLPEDTRIVFFQRNPTSGNVVDLWFEAYEMGERFYYFGGREKQLYEKPPDPAVGLPTLVTIERPFVVFSDLNNPVVERRIREILASRFPNVTWKQTDEGQPWSLAYFHVP